MRKTILCLSVVSLLALGGPAIAELGTIDAVPAATLLIPNFRVELDNEAGLTTLFSINNASAAPVLAHVTLWTDWSIPTIDFDVYLTGFDVQTFNLRDLFTTGSIPQTAPINAISNLGAFSLPHSVPASCAGQLPVGNLLPVQLQLLRAAHTGQPVVFPGEPGNQCWGENYGEPEGERVARGYITVDVVEECSVQFPNSPGYFSTIAGFDNVLWGDYFYVDPSNNFAQGETAVHIEAGAVDTGGVCLDFAPGDYTFYGRYVPVAGGFGATDCREPLGTTYATRYLTGAAFSGGTELACWRDSKTDPQPIICGTGRPNPMPLGQTQVVVFDEEENPDLVTTIPIPSPVPPGEVNAACPIETQITEVGGPNLPAAFDNGWIYLNLNTATGSVVDPIAQAWITTIMSAEGRYSVGFDAIQLDNASDSTCFILSDGGVILPCA